MNCTIFAISDSDLEMTSDSLPGFETGVNVISRTDTSSALELGARWPAVHAALGGHGPEHPLGFLDSGGEVRPEFAAANSSGRYFPAPSTVQILAALSRIASPPRDIEGLRMFIADVVARGRGLIVYQFS